jgi:hypothetical protein
MNHPSHLRPIPPWRVALAVVACAQPLASALAASPAELDVMGRECTAGEKTDVIAWLITLKP